MIAVAAGCWLAVPSGASAQALNVSGLTSAATGAVAANGSTVEKTVTTVAPVAGPAQGAVTQVAGTVGRVTAPEGPVARVGTRTADAAGAVVERVNRTAGPVAGAADRVVREVQPVVDETLDDPAGTVRDAVQDGITPGAGAAQEPPRVERQSGPTAGRGDSGASGQRLRGAARPDRPDPGVPGPPAERVSSVFTPLIPIGLPGSPAGGGDADPATPASGVLELPADPEPASGAPGGSAAASVSFSLGGLALLLAMQSLAGPALRRRLPRRPVMGWPAAFVPLLERPG